MLLVGGGSRALVTDDSLLWPRQSAVTWRARLVTRFDPLPYEVPDKSS